MHKPVSSELNWPMYSTHAIIIAKQKEMKNLPVQEAKLKMVACFGSLGFSSLLCFFSSFTFLGRLFSLCICLSASVFVLLRSFLFSRFCFSVSSSCFFRSSSSCSSPFCLVRFSGFYLLFVLCPAVFVPTVLSSPFVSVLPPLSQSVALLLLRSCADIWTVVECYNKVTYDAVKKDSSRCYCWTELLQKEEMVAKGHPLSLLQWRREKNSRCWV